MERTNSVSSGEREEEGGTRHGEGVKRHKPLCIK